MTNQSDRLKNQLKNADDEFTAADFERDAELLEKQRFERKRPFRNFVVIVLIVISGSMFLNSSSSLNPLTWFSSGQVFSSGPSEDLLNRMNGRMIEMGYIGLTHDDLRALRADGLTATYVSNVRALGFPDLTLEEARSLAKANASSAFIAMMIELGYPLTVDQILMLKDAGVTAHYTSNIHDLGYRDITIDQLIRMRRIGVTAALVKRLQSERGEDLPMEEIIRYRISNQ
jgi:hypothetical protein